MKKILLAGVLALGLSGVALADDFGYEGDYDFNPGIYFGGQFGVANTHYRGSDYLKPTNSFDDGSKFAARGYLGYAFSQFISLELGYDYYGRPKFKDVSGHTQNISQYGIDLVAKASLPLDYGFALYAKGGMAWVFRSALNSNGGTFESKEANRKLTPVFGIGVNYWFVPNIALDIAWTKTMRINDLPTTDVFTLGFIYKINI